jgi:hypothetical protein
MVRDHVCNIQCLGTAYTLLSAEWQCVHCSKLRNHVYILSAYRQSYKRNPNLILLIKQWVPGNWQLAQYPEGRCTEGPGFKSQNCCIPELNSECPRSPRQWAHSNSMSQEMWIMNSCKWARNGDQPGNMQIQLRATDMFLSMLLKHTELAYDQQLGRVPGKWPKQSDHFYSVICFRKKLMRKNSLLMKLQEYNKLCLLPGGMAF